MSSKNFKERMLANVVGFRGSCRALFNDFSFHGSNWLAHVCGVACSGRRALRGSTFFRGKNDR